MQPPKPPKIAAVNVVRAQPTIADEMALTHLSAHSEAAASQVSYVVKIKLATKPPVTSLGWGLYVKDVRIPKYWEYEDGIYFTVTDPEFLTKHKGERLRFSHDGVEFQDTGAKLPAAPSSVEPVPAVAMALTSGTPTAARSRGRVAKKIRTTRTRRKAKSKRKRR